MSEVQTPFRTGDYLTADELVDSLLRGGAATETRFLLNMFSDADLVCREALRLIVEHQEKTHERFISGRAIRFLRRYLDERYPEEGVDRASQARGPLPWDGVESTANAPLDKGRLRFGTIHPKSTACPSCLSQEIYYTYHSHDLPVDLEHTSKQTKIFIEMVCASCCWHWAGERIVPYEMRNSPPAFDEELCRFM